MRFAVHQPNYIPWCGYFAKMCVVDVFVFLDDAEISTGQSYVYRARVYSPASPVWLSVPCHRALGQQIREVKLMPNGWASKHLNKLRSYYAKAPFFGAVFDLVAPLYSDLPDTLSEFNMRLIRTIARYLSIDCRFEVSSSLRPTGTGDDRHICLARILSAETYVSGKGGNKYQDPAKFAQANLALEVREYTPVPYPHVRGAFQPGLSIVDALFHLGPRTAELLTYQAGQN